MLVSWPSHTSEYAQVWKLLELCGLAKSTRQALQYTNFGYVFIDGNQATRKTTTPIGKQITLEVRFPEGRTTSVTFMVVHIDPKTKGPSTLQDTTYFRGKE